MGKMDLSVADVDDQVEQAVFEIHGVPALGTTPKYYEVPTT